jgi:hypothetical protein
LGGASIGSDQSSKKIGDGPINMTPSPQKKEKERKKEINK